MTLGSQQKTIGTSQVHLTPRWIIDALGPCDLDPSAADPQPWDCAQVNPPWFVASKLSRTRSLANKEHRMTLRPRTIKLQKLVGD